MTKSESSTLGETGSRERDPLRDRVRVPENSDGWLALTGVDKFPFDSLSPSRNTSSVGDLLKTHQCWLGKLTCEPILNNLYPLVVFMQRAPDSRIECNHLCISSLLAASMTYSRLLAAYVGGEKDSKFFHK